MPKFLSCGVIVRRVSGELLLCHATGRNYWDIPKGLRDPGESSVNAALRELREETGLLLQPEQLQDLGVHRYLPGKDLQLFVLHPPDPSIDIDPCACSTYYTVRGSTRRYRSTTERATLNSLQAAFACRPAASAVVKHHQGQTTAVTGRPAPAPLSTDPPPA